MKQFEKMTKDERSLLIFLEVRAIDHGGKVDTRHMNKEDMDLANKWHKEKLIQFGRINSNHLSGYNTHVVILSEEAIDLAYLCRKRRINANIPSQDMFVQSRRLKETG